MGKILKFRPRKKPPPVPEVPAHHPKIENVTRKALAAFRMLSREFKSETRIPECMFLVYGSRWPDNPDTLSWSYLALDMDPAEVLRVARLTARHLKKNPETQVEIPDPETEGRSRPASGDEDTDYEQLDDGAVPDDPDCA